MSAPAAIDASLVNMRNVGTHKCVALTIHVPEERAQEIIAAFGWPTMAAPVPVALARLKEMPGDVSGQGGKVKPLGAPEGVRPSASPPGKKAWADMRPSQQAAIRCGERPFQEWLSARDAEDAAVAVRAGCRFKSRRDLDMDPAARALWRRMDTDYLVSTGRMAAPR